MGSINLGEISRPEKLVDEAVGVDPGHLDPRRRCAALLRGFLPPLQRSLGSV